MKQSAEPATTAPALRSLYAEFDEEERMLAEAGLDDYGRLLAEDEARE